jgi:hypothetical protein
MGAVSKHAGNQSRLQAVFPGIEVASARIVDAHSNSCRVAATDERTAMPAEVRKKSARALRGMFFKRIFVVKTSKDRADANAQPSGDRMSIG